MRWSKHPSHYAAKRFHAALSLHNEKSISQSTSLSFVLALLLVYKESPTGKSSDPFYCTFPPRHPNTYFCLWSILAFGFFFSFISSRCHGTLLMFWLGWLFRPHQRLAEVSWRVIWLVGGWRLAGLSGKAVGRIREDGNGRTPVQTWQYHVEDVWGDHHRH